MTEEQVIKLVLKYTKKIFPKRCNCCGKVYNNYRDFILQTHSIGVPESYDPDFDSGEKTIKLKFIGTQSFYNCDCGSTLVLGTGVMNIVDGVKLMLWGRREAKKRGMNIREFALVMRKTVHQRVIDLGEK